MEAPRKLKATWTIEPYPDSDAALFLFREPKFKRLHDFFLNIIVWFWKKYDGRCYNCYCRWSVKRWMRKWPHRIDENTELFRAMREAIDAEILREIEEELRKEGLIA